MRDIFKNGKIDYKEFNKSIKFDFESIEIELGKLILPGVKKFIIGDNNNNEPIKFISFLYAYVRYSKAYRYTKDCSIRRR